MRALALALLLASACSDSNPYADLYKAPVGQATSSIHGTWGGSVEGFDVRWVLSPSQVTFANKCGDRIVGLDAAAEVTSAMIRILESAEGGNDSCYVRTSPATTPTCSTDPFMPKNNCFVLMGTTLTVYETNVSYLALTKLTDAVY